MGLTADIKGIKKFYKNIANKYIVHFGDSDNLSNTYEENILFKTILVFRCVKNVYFVWVEPLSLPYVHTHGREAGSTHTKKCKKHEVQKNLKILHFFFLR